MSHTLLHPEGLEPEIRRRLKRGVFARREAAGQWSLYEPTRDTACRFGPSGDRRRGDWLGPADLESNDNCWPADGFDSQRYYLAHAFRAHRPLREANLEVHYACRYACRHCFQSIRPLRSQPDLPDWATLRAAAERVLRAGVQDLAITGGDIFLHPDLWRLLDYLHARAPQVTLRLLVNGGGLDPRTEVTRRRLAALAGRRVIVKSEFFGHDSNLHDDFTRVPGAFERLVAIGKLCRETEVPFLAAGLLTRRNFATRFELVNFLHNLTGDRFGMRTLLYPSAYRQPLDVRELSLTADQHARLLQERYFAPLVSQYHDFEPQCGGDCQLAVVAHDGSAWGCSFLKEDFSAIAAGQPGAAEPESSAASAGPATSGLEKQAASLSERLVEWRAGARHMARRTECAGCEAEDTCRRCPSFRASREFETAYCELARQAHGYLAERMDRARRAGFREVHAPEPHDPDHQPRGNGS